MSQNNQLAQTYMIAFSTEETQRLMKMGRLLSPSTRQLLERAGIAAGMKVLDVGSGAGDVALLAGELVGPSGMVVGVESNPQMLEIARARVQVAGLRQVSLWDRISSRPGHARKVERT